MARFSIATNESYKNSKGEKVQNTNWHTLVAWGKTADIIEKFVSKGKELGVKGKLRTRKYTTDDGTDRYAHFRPPQVTHFARPIQDSINTNF